MNKGEKLIIKNAIDFIIRKQDGRLTNRPTEKERIKNKCPKCGLKKVDLVYGLGGMGVGQMYFCKNKNCGWKGFDLKT